MRILLPLLAACTPTSKPSCTVAGPHLVVATTDFTVGALASYSPTTGCLADRQASTGGDPLLVRDQGRLFLANRGGGDVLRELDPQDLTSPIFEVALEPGANAHDLLVVQDSLWITRYDLDSIAILDKDGASLSEISLADLADGDGIPEADTMVRVGDVVVVALQRFRRDDGWSAGSGRLVVLDSAHGAVISSVETGPSPRVFAGPNPDSTIVLTGVYGQPDGAMFSFTPSSGTLTELLTEERAGVDLAMYAQIADVGVILGTDFDLSGTASAWCWDGVELNLAQQEQAWYADVAVGDGLAWIAVRSGWGVGGNAGLASLDPITCAMSEVVPMDMEPYSLVYVE